MVGPNGEPEGQAPSVEPRTAGGVPLTPDSPPVLEPGQPDPQLAPPEAAPAAPAAPVLTEAQQVISRAREQANTLHQRLDQLFPMPPPPAGLPPAGYPGTARPGWDPRFAAPPPSAPAARPGPPVAGPLLSEAEFDDFKAAYDSAKDDAAALRVLLNRSVELAVNKLQTRPELLTPVIRAHAPGVIRAVEQTQDARRSEQARVESGAAELEGFWNQVAPGIPARLLWSYADEAERRIPTREPADLTRQAMYCLERAIQDGYLPATAAASGAPPVSSPTNARQRALEGTLPGAGPSAPPAGAAEPHRSMYEQMRDHRRQHHFVGSR